ncbi:MAG TPA: hypothetical protein VF525_08005 [Pyrinomonadaceae bacterium]|jgi:hypothetical protein
MKFLSLERLEGPGKSVDENFEIMSLELIKADLPSHESFRLSAPDGGIDIYSRATTEDGVNLAFQCKAYPTFRSSLVQAVARSARAALSSSGAYPWNRYHLIIPFVPTSIQRAKLEEVLRECHTLPEIYLPHIVDGDELEATLFRHPAVARRFFPSLIVVTPCEQARILLGYPDDPTMLQLELRIHTWKQTLPVTVSPIAKAGSLLQMLIGQLTLPIKGSVTCVGIEHYDVNWELILEGEPERVLDPERALPEQGIASGATIFLRYSYSVTGGGAFLSGLNRAYQPEQYLFYTILDSHFERKIHMKPEGVREFEDKFSYWLDFELKSRESVLQKDLE